MKRLIIVLVFLLSMSLVSAISVDDFSLADLGFTGFVVEANLDTSGTAQVLYGKTGALGSASNLASSSNEHLLQVDGLESGTVYFYRVVGKDSSGNSYSSAISLTRTASNSGSSTPSVVDDGKLKAFPSAYGGGSSATGGRGGVLVKVNTLNIDAPLKYYPKSGNRDAYYTGGFKAAVENKIGPRYIVFDVSGTIVGNGETDHNKNLVAREQFGHTIFGQSAPRGGITLHKTYLRYSKSGNIIIRYLRSRPGIVQGNPIQDDYTSSPFIVIGNNVILDHVSASWGGDKSIIVGDRTRGFVYGNITVSNSMLSDSHTNGFSVIQSNELGADYKESGDMSWVYNFIAGSHRTPNMGGFLGYGEIQNNVVQNKATRLSNINYGHTHINHVGNYYRVYSSAFVKNVFTDFKVNTATIHTKNNYYENDEGVKLTGSSTEDNQIIWQHRTTKQPLTAEFFSSQSFYGKIRNPAPLLTPQQAKQHVMDNAGANKYLDNDGNAGNYRDSYDTIALNNLKNDKLTFRKYSSDWILPSLPTNTRPSSYDSDNDGMSDAWERRTFGNLAQSYRGDFDGDGYTNIEEYMNQVDFS